MKSEVSSHQKLAEFRFSIIGPLLSSPPGPGELQDRLEELSACQWQHPLTGEPIKLGCSTIQRWYYRAKKKGADPVGSLRRKLRSDRGEAKSIHPPLRSWLNTNYRLHTGWSYQLHSDNLKAWCDLQPEAGTVPSYSSVVRYMASQGFRKTRRPRSPLSPGQKKALARLEDREVRSFEAEYVGGLWHLDFHHASRQVIKGDGSFVTPLCLCILDDHSRLACHVQWYFQEDTKALVQGFSQALKKRQMPRALMSDNGGAMISEEFTQGLMRLGIEHETTLPHSPYQNGKQESFWGNLEGRLMAMLENDKNLTLQKLNQMTQIWVEREYHLNIHSETTFAPLDRFVHAKDVLRPLPDIDLGLIFRRDVKRTARHSDGTFSLEGKRFEIPQAYRILKTLTVRYARWDLSQIHLVDEQGQCLAQVFPVDLKKNADGQRRLFNKPDRQMNLPLIELSGEEPPLLSKMIAEYSATGCPPAYIPMTDEET